MKKILSVILVLAALAGIGTVAFAEEQSAFKATVVDFAEPANVTGSGDDVYEGYDDGEHVGIVFSGKYLRKISGISEEALWFNTELVYFTVCEDGEDCGREAFKVYSQQDGSCTMVLCRTFLEKQDAGMHNYEIILNNNEMNTFGVTIELEK